MESCSKKTDEKMDKFLQTITDSVGSQLQRMNTTIVKMKEEGDDRYKKSMKESRIWKIKISDIDEKCENRNDELNRSHDDQSQGKAVATGFHSETSESEVEQLLKETIIEAGMSIENARIECPAKPITHAFIFFKGDDERNKYVKSANMLRKELRGRKIKTTRSISIKKMGYVKYCSHMRRNVSVKGQIVVNHVKVGLSSVSSTKTSNFESKIK